MSATRAKYEQVPGNIRYLCVCGQPAIKSVFIQWAGYVCPITKTMVTVQEVMNAALMPSPKDREE